MRTSLCYTFFGARVKALDEQYLICIHSADEIPLLTLAIPCIVDLHVLAFGGGSVLSRSIFRWLEDLNRLQVVVSNSSSVAYRHGVALDAGYRSPNVDDPPATAFFECMASKFGCVVKRILQDLLRTVRRLVDVNVAGWKDSLHWRAVIACFEFALQRSLVHCGIVPACDMTEDVDTGCASSENMTKRQQNFLWVLC